MDEKKPERGIVRLWIDFENRTIEEVKRSVGLSVDELILAITKQVDAVETEPNSDYKIHVGVDGDKLSFRGENLPHSHIPLIVIDSIPPNYKAEITPENLLMALSLDLPAPTPMDYPEPKKKKLNWQQRKWNNRY